MDLVIGLGFCSTWPEGEKVVHDLHCCFHLA